MAIYHLSVKVIGRAAGRSATAAAAYRAAEKIVDQRTGLVHDFTRKRGVEHTELVLPGGTHASRTDFWNRVETHHKRGDAVLAREVEIALPDELTKDERRTLATAFARELADRYKVAADVAVHAPSREGDERNHHAHIMLSACSVGEDGTLGKKAVELDPIHCQRHGLGNMADRERARWEEIVNVQLERAGHAARVDHRSLQAQGIDRVPTSHLGPAVAGMKRRGASSDVGQRIANEVADHLKRAREMGELERHACVLDQSIIDASSDLAAALRDREEMVQLKANVGTGKASFRSQFKQHQEAEGAKDALMAFRAFQVEQAYELAKEHAQREASAQELARQRAEAQTRAGRMRDGSKLPRERGGPLHKR
ncbi:MobA/MobL family protein [Duganella sp. FT109W]|uniref:MobA/MobL family protein n=1 Tax=Duganella margarita TaxID=2692170 RepID=A0A7X4GZ05_9BURK|nr:MobQ family relaxase [Duganella margarita]MYM72195.1 MobA/MobL family protein [Duganella margarita]MYN39652.1 MobA/MobL family protein [Duganella margarita]